MVGQVVQNICGILGDFHPKKAGKEQKKPMPNSQISTRYWARDIFGFLDIYDFLRNILWKMLTLPHGKWGKSGYNTKIYKSFWRTRFINEISQNFTIAESRENPKSITANISDFECQKTMPIRKRPKNQYQSTDFTWEIGFLGRHPSPILVQEMLWLFAIILYLTKWSKDCTLYKHLILRYWILIWKWFPGSWQVLLTI